MIDSGYDAGGQDDRRLVAIGKVISSFTAVYLLILLTIPSILFDEHSALYQTHSLAFPPILLKV